MFNNLRGPQSLRRIGLLILLACAPVSAFGEDLPPVYDTEDLKLDTSRLVPHRLLYDPREGADGFDSGLFTDGVYKTPQVSITLDRTVFYDAPDSVRDAIRVRWVSNTHPHLDEILVDAKTLSTINETTRAGRNWQTKNETIYVRGDKAHVIATSDDAAPEMHEYPLNYQQHYGLMIFPYLFAAMDVPAGAAFRLPALGSDKEAFVEISVVGPASFTNADNEEQQAFLVTSKHSWAEIDWYVDKENAPFHAHAVWRYGPGDPDAPSAVSKVVDWVTFEADRYVDVVDRKALQKRAKED